LATFNDENLHARAKALRATSLGEVNPVLAAFERFNSLSAKLAYDAADTATMLEDLRTLDILKLSAAGNLRMSTQRSRRRPGHPPRTGRLPQDAPGVGRVVAEENRIPGAPALGANRRNYRP